MARVYLGLGSNLGDRRSGLRAASALLVSSGVNVVRASSLYESEPMYELDQPHFLNAVIQGETELSPDELLHAVKKIERQLGRQPRARNGPREIDIDILLYDDVRLDATELTLPHPRMEERPFVVVPLRELLDDHGPSSKTQATGLTPYPGPLPDRERGLRIVEGPEWIS